MKPAHLKKGQAAEQLAEKYLVQHKLNVVKRNYRSRFGEIDLICLDKKELVFVEVRFRSHRSFGSAAETVTISKQTKLIKTAQYFLASYSKYANHQMRFDVIGIDANDDIEWIKGAFLSAS